MNKEQFDDFSFLSKAQSPNTRLLKMGYTHYLSLKNDNLSIEDIKRHPNFAKTMDILESIAIDQEDQIRTSQCYMDEGDKHYFRNDDMIIFTGYESMVFPAKEYPFCKTRREPFDKAVVACYHVASTLMGDIYEFFSDGDEEDLVSGRALGNRMMSEYIK